MSTVDLDAIRKRAERAHEEVCGLADGSRKWRMRIPAQPERDSDLVIAAVLADVETLLMEVERLTRQRDEARAMLEEVRQELGGTREESDRFGIEVERLRAEVTRLDADIAAERDMIAAEGYRRGWNAALGMSRAAVAGDSTGE